MRGGAKVSVIIPALNEEASIGGVLAEIPVWVDQVLVVDNGSTDRTAAMARAAGACVLDQPERGYGAACLLGIEALGAPDGPDDVVVFLDGDHADSPGEMARLADLIVAGEADVVVGSRVRGSREPGALTPQARFGNWLACGLMRLLWGTRYTDLGPFRAIRHRELLGLGMRDRNYGWTVEMQVRAAQHGLATLEVPVSYRRRRVGRSKVSGTVRGVVGAGTKILGTILVLAMRGR